MEEELRKNVQEWGENSCITVTAKYTTNLQQLNWWWQSSYEAKPRLYEELWYYQDESSD